MENLINWLQEEFGLSVENQQRLFLSCLTISIVILVRLALLRIVFQKISDDRVRYAWRKTSTYVSFVFVVVMVGRVWFVGFQSLSTFLGLLSAGLAIALQVPIVNLAGWAFLLWHRPFEVGDRIEIAKIRGDVIDQSIFMFTLMEVGNWVDSDQSTGRIIHIPNGKVFQESIANYSKGFHYIWHETPVLITFESNWQKAEKLLTAIVNQHSEYLTKSAQKKVKEAAKKYLIQYKTLTPIVYLSVRDSGVLLTLRFLCDPRKRRGTENRIWKDILLAVEKCNDIDFAYPTHRYYNNQIEGKSGSGGPSQTKEHSPTYSRLD